MDVRFANIETRRHHVKPRLRWGDPHGMGTGQIQCMSDYIAELADSHWMLTSAFWNVAVIREILRKTVVRDRLRTPDLKTLNGYGPGAKAARQYLCIATGWETFPFLAYLPLGSALDHQGHGLMTGELKWCVQCWINDVENGVRPYVRLLWIASSSTCCPIHNIALTRTCPACGKHQPVGSQIPRAWICQRCGVNLIRQRNQRGAPYRVDKRGLWIAGSLEKLIAEVSSSDQIVNANAGQKAIIRIANEHSDGSAYRLAKMLNLSGDVVDSWMKGEGRPSLDALLELCFRVDIPPYELLSDQGNMTDPSRWRRLEMPRFAVRRALTIDALGKVRRILKRVIRQNPKRACSLKELAGKLHMTYLNIQYHFPEEYEIIRERYERWQTALVKKTAAKRLARLEKSVVALQSQSIYPSERHLKERTRVRPSDLRRPEVKRRLRTLQMRVDSRPLRENRKCRDPKTAAKRRKAQKTRRAK